MELASYDFINEYDTRPNKLFIDYLIYPKEVMGTFVKSYMASMVFSFICFRLLHLYFSYKKSSS